MPDELSPDAKKVIGVGVALILFMMFFSNPTERKFKIHLAEHGWVPTKVDHTSLGLFSFGSATGFTGAKGKWLGLFGNFIQISGDE